MIGRRFRRRERHSDRRAGYAWAAVAVFGIEVLIALFVHDRVIRPFIGDSLAVMLVYLVLRAITPLKVTLAAATAFGIACLVEFGQWIGLLDILGLRDNRLARVVLGSHFDAMDFVAYGFGAVFALALEYGWRKWRQRRRR